MKKAPKMTAAQRLARIQDINRKLQQENDMLKTNYGVDAQMGIDEEPYRAALPQQDPRTVESVRQEAMSYMPQIEEGVNESLQPVLDQEGGDEYDMLARKYARAAQRQLAPSLAKAFNPIFPRKRM